MTWEEKAIEMNLSNEDFMATLTELTARTIADACSKFLPSGASLEDVYIFL